MKTVTYFIIITVLLISIPIFVVSQVGISTDNSTPDNSAILDLKSTTLGFLPPRMTQSQISAIKTPANGLIVFCTTDNKLYLYVASANIWKEVSYGIGTIATFPSVTTTAVTNTTPTTATAGGNVTSDGGATATARGVCWNTTSNPTITDSHTTDGTGTGVFVSNLTGLTQGIYYYFRAYAVNSIGTSYGNQLSFWTFYIGQNYGGGIIFYIDGTGQQGLIAPTSDQSINAQWGCYGTLIGGTGTAIGTGQANTTAVVNGCTTTGIAARICDDLVLNGYSDWFLPSKDELNQMYLQKNIIGGFASDLYLSSSEVDNNFAWSQRLSDGYHNTSSKFTPSYVRAIRAFPSLPTITTNAVTNITSTTATGGGNVTSDGGATVTVRGVCWSTSTHPTTIDSHTTDGTGTGVFVSNLTGLTGNTFYFVRAYATNSVGTSYGNQQTFSTSPILATITTTAITNITQTTGTSGGDVTSDGGATVTARGICWNTTASPTIADSHTADGSGTGVFVSNLTGLSANTLYYIRAYATNSVGISYGNQISFTTLPNFTIGLAYGGGIIFYIDGTGQHGLIAALNDQSINAQWGCYGTLIGGTSTAIGTGQANTTAIVNGCNTTGIAARICDDLILNGYSDWFLPSKDELNQMYLQKTIIGGFASDLYLSSSEVDNNFAWSQRLSDGYHNTSSKFTPSYVRAVRAF